MAINFDEQKRDKLNRTTKIIKEDLPSVINKTIHFKKGITVLNGLEADYIDNSIIGSITPAPGKFTTGDFSGQLQGALLNNQMVSLATFDVLSLMDSPLFLNMLCNNPGAGVMYDVSGNGHNGSYQGGMTIDDRIKQALGWIVEYDGSNDHVTFSDHTDFSFGDSSNDYAFTFIFVINVVDGPDRSIMSKWDEYTAGGLREWDIVLTAAEKLQLLQYDESVNKQCSKIVNTALSLGMHLCGITSPGDGGATAMNNVKFYVDGAVVASTATNNADYVAMENTVAQPRISARLDSGGNQENFYDSGMAMVGSDGSEWSAAKMNQLWHLTKGLYGV